ncbi:MAG: large conductance mechanosensitive channel protein MscL [Actinomycetales bacterium]
MVKGFRDFIMRGNIVDLAVAFVIGAAFAKMVADFVSAIITPILNAFPGAKSNGWGFSLRGGDLHRATFVNISTLVNSVVVFVITALVVYLIFVVPMNKLAERRKRGVEPEPEAPAADILLLQQIRDLLAARGGAV